MKGNEKSSIINIAPNYSFNTTANISIYVSARVALVVMTRSMSLELGKLI